MKNIHLIFPLAAAVMMSLASCDRSPAPTFTFESYQQEFDTKQPFKVDMSYIRITNADKSKALKAIEESNRKAFFAIDGELPRTMRKIFDMAAAQFRDVNNCDKQQFSHGPYELMVKSDIEVFDCTLSYIITGYQFTGGAHGISWIKGLNYSLETGQLLTLDDFFTPEQKAKLSAALTRLLCWQLGMADTDIAKLSEMGYYPENIKPTDNFFVTSTGITFLYTPYEIGCYAVGMPRIELPYSSIDSLLE